MVAHTQGVPSFAGGLLVLLPMVVTAPLTPIARSDMRASIFRDVPTARGPARRSRNASFPRRCFLREKLAWIWRACRWFEVPGGGRYEKMEAEMAKKLGTANDTLERWILSNRSQTADTQVQLSVLYSYDLYSVYD